MKKSDFYFDLPKELIAQTPLDKRDNSRLLYMNKETGEISHNKFFEIPKFLNKDDLLVLNNSKVIPARIYGKKIETLSKVEFLLLKNIKDNIWESLVKPGKKAKIGDKFIFNDGIVSCKIIDIIENGNRIIEFDNKKNFLEILDKIGEMPIPPYITTKLSDKQRYQTVYSDKLGSVAAPTAGLHFTKKLIKSIKQKKVNIAYITLHIGIGTFKPVKTDNIEDHIMHNEFFSITDKTANLISKTKQNKRKVIAVGTTSCRALESMYKINGDIKKTSGNTDIFIYPGYEFKVIDGLITNFHLPESTLIMLVSALAGHKNVMEAYKQAIHHKYRFFSFGDSMIII